MRGQLRVATIEVACCFFSVSTPTDFCASRSYCTDFHICWVVAFVATVGKGAETFLQRTDFRISYVTTG